jgi:hypothetical protein
MPLESEDPYPEDDRSPGHGDARRTPPRSGTVTGRTTFVVVAEQNEHGALTIEDPETYATYHVVDYASPRLRDRAGRLERGTTVGLSLSRAGYRANAWRVEELSVRVGSATPP